MTNTRSLSEEQAKIVTHEVMQNLTAAVDQHSIKSSQAIQLQIISRGDSTLRGHFPAETDVVRRYLAGPDDQPAAGLPVLLIPAFFEGGRVTVNDVHYLITQQDRYLPVALSPFARDPHFGYRSSNLRDWVAEKTRGKVAR